jgi:hypothetical protein
MTPLVAILITALLVFAVLYFIERRLGKTRDELIAVLEAQSSAAKELIALYRMKIKADEFTATGQPYVVSLSGGKMTVRTKRDDE